MTTEIAEQPLVDVKATVKADEIDFAYLTGFSLMYHPMLAVKPTILMKMTISIQRSIAPYAD